MAINIRKGMTPGPINHIKRPTSLYISFLLFAWATWQYLFGFLSPSIVYSILFYGELGNFNQPTMPMALSSLIFELVWIVILSLTFLFAYRLAERITKTQMNYSQHNNIIYLRKYLNSFITLFNSLFFLVIVTLTVIYTSDGAVPLIKWDDIAHVSEENAVYGVRGVLALIILQITTSVFYPCPRPKHLSQNESAYMQKLTFLIPSIYILIISTLLVPLIYLYSGWSFFSVLASLVIWAVFGGGRL